MVNFFTFSKWRTQHQPVTEGDSEADLEDAAGAVVADVEGAAGVAVDAVAKKETRNGFLSPSLADL